jgi:hypothetical protein
VRGLLLGLVLAGVIVGCMRTGHHPPPVPPDRFAKISLINDLWVQIRDFRKQAGMQLDPPDPLERQFRNVPFGIAKVACPEEQATAPTCSDICVLANHICDNAETICKIADELGKDDPAQEKCTSAKASCREAKQKCCNCNADPPPAAEILPPAGGPSNAGS